jgi:hypothetical protein
MEGSEMAKNSNVAAQLFRAAELRRNPRYKERAKAQALAWAQGRPYHETFNDECCPDFSCCFPHMFEKDAKKRWEQYRREWGDDS